MPKFNEQPESARPLKKILPEILMLGGFLDTTVLKEGNEHEREVLMDIPSTIRKIYDYIKVRINDDVCITKEQEKFFVDDVRRLADSGAENNISVLQNFVAMINSYRFECHNCLNRSCKKRNVTESSV